MKTHSSHHVAWCVVGSAGRTEYLGIARRCWGFYEGFGSPSTALLNVIEGCGSGIKLLASKVGFLSSVMYIRVKRAFQVESLREDQVQ